METLQPWTEVRSEDPIRRNVEALRRVFPEVVREGRVDFVALRETLGDLVDDHPEQYRFTWNGKSRARRIARTPTEATLRPCPQESVNWDTARNVFVEGDNLEVLKVLQKAYHKQVKMIFIDPPYNTGKEFVYRDDFKDHLAAYLDHTRQLDRQGFKVSSNSETSGRYHTNWLNMMYPRLELSRGLLSDDGVLLVTIDDREVTNLRKILDEIFGEENFLAMIAWQKRYTRGNNASLFCSMKDNILVYRKSAAVEQLREPRTDKADSIYSNPDDDDRGPWTSSSYVNPATKRLRPNLVYPIRNPANGRIVRHPTHAWKYEQAEYRRHAAENRLWWGKTGNARYPRLKLFLREAAEGMVPVDLWDHESSGTTDEGTLAVKKLFDGLTVFDNPKPPRLIQRMLTMCTGPDDLVLDFFAGSATTADAVLTLNELTASSRRFLLVQLPEPCGARSAAAAAGYRTVADVGKERIRRVIRRIEAERPASTESRADAEGDDSGDGGGDLPGFRVFKLDRGTLNARDIDPRDIDSKDIDSNDVDDRARGADVGRPGDEGPGDEGPGEEGPGEERAGDDDRRSNGRVESSERERGELDLLYELMLRSGLPLTETVRRREIEGRRVFVVGDGRLVACLDDDVSLRVVRGIATLGESLVGDRTTVVFKDEGFEDDMVKMNAVRILKRVGIREVRGL